MTGTHYIPTEKIADFVDSILVVEKNDVKKSFSLPLFANGKPTLLFQTTKGTVNSNSNYLTLFGQTILPEQSKPAVKYLFNCRENFGKMIRKELI